MDTLDKGEEDPGLKTVVDKIPGVDSIVGKVPGLKTVTGKIPGLGGDAGEIPGIGSLTKKIPGLDSVSGLGSAAKKIPGLGSLVKKVPGLGGSENDGSGETPGTSGSGIGSLTKKIPGLDSVPGLGSAAKKIPGLGSLVKKVPGLGGSENDGSGETPGTSGSGIGSLTKKIPGLDSVTKKASGLGSAAKKIPGLGSLVKKVPGLGSSKDDGIEETTGTSESGIELDENDNGSSKKLAESSSLDRSDVERSESVKSSRSVTTSKVMLVVLAVLGLVIIAALIVGVVALTQASGSSSGGLGAQVACYGQSSPSGATTLSGKPIYTIAHGHAHGPYEYLSEDKDRVDGFYLDLLSEVCEAAGVDCRAVWEPYTNCFETIPGEENVGGVGLLSHWYDACMGWAVTDNRLQVFKFSAPFLKADTSAIFVKMSDSAIDLVKILVEKIGFIESWVYDDKCLTRLYGIPVAPSKTVYYKTPEELKNGVLSGEVAAAYASIGSLIDYTLTLPPVLKGIPIPGSCMKEGPAMMSRKESNFPGVWNFGFSKLVASGRFKQLCTEGKAKHASPLQSISCV